MSKKLVGLCACLCLSWSVNLPQVKAQEMLPEKTTHQFNRTRPNRDRPTQVAVGIYLIDFDKFGLLMSDLVMSIWHEKLLI
jgi:hypothetical protein